MSPPRLPFLYAAPIEARGRPHSSGTCHPPSGPAKTGPKLYSGAVGSTSWNHATHIAMNANNPMIHSMSHLLKRKGLLTGHVCSSARHSGHIPSHVQLIPNESFCRFVQPPAIACSIVEAPISTSHKQHAGVKVHSAHAAVATQSEA